MAGGKAWAAALAVLGLTGAAWAQGDAASLGARASILGDWAFQTPAYDNGACRMSGAMTIRRSAGGLTCTFVASEACTWGTIRAEQTCTLKRDGARVVMTSTIQRLTPPSSSYAPDDWVLEIKNATRMVGELRSADVAPVEFYRVQSAPIS